MSSIKALSVVIPVYNEEEVIISTIDKIHSILKKLNIVYEIVVVNDGSTDRTSEVLMSYGGEIVLLNRDVNRGYGFSLKEGIERATGDWILITDADGTYPLEDIPLFVSECSHADMIVGERSGKSVRMGLFNKLAKVILKKLIYILAYKWVTDINSGLRLFKKEMALRYWDIYPDGFSFTTTLTVAAIIEKYKVKYIPINYYKRTGKSHIKPMRDFFSFVFLILRIVTFFRPLRFFLPISFCFFVFSVVRSLRDIFITNAIGTFAVLLFIISIQSFFFGLLADLIVVKFRGKRINI
ncbi:glycosyltransferase family 2 protein [candidate division WS5 bacterium]|uniref:Glycosyltransferase family 2 protein n=1 Tax=candidate division WS5 bacterium TaxID=2093353 RepID=A0A419DEX9_9BACT|nr:MAG: glycosyltransferase family 2 protein [candidate division WS5 bacterium]